MSDDIEEKIMNAIDPAISTTQSTPNFGVIGNSGLSRWNQDVFEEFMTNLRWPRAAKVYKEMSSNDPVIGSIFMAARQLIKKCTWRVKPASDTKVDLEAAEFLDSCREDMSITWSDLIDEITSYFEYGWAYHEIIYKKRDGMSKDPSRNSKYKDGRIGWRKVSGRSQESWAGWIFDEKSDGGLVGMAQYLGDKKVIIPIEKSLLFRSTAVRNNPEGKSFLRNAYRPWYFKKHIEEIEGIGLERDLAGLPVLHVPENVDIFDVNNAKAVSTLAAAQVLVRNIRRDKNEGIVLPFGWELVLLASGSSRQFDTNVIINRYDQRIAITMLADIVMLGADKVGSFALAEVKKGLLAAALDAQVHGIIDVFNRYAIPRLFEFNVFPGMTNYPTIEASPVDSPDMKELADYIQKLSGAGMPLFPNIDLENALRTIANLPQTTESDPAREAALATAETNKKKQTQVPPEPPADNPPPAKPKKGGNSQ